MMKNLTTMNERELYQEAARLRHQLFKKDKTIETWQALCFMFAVWFIAAIILMA